jgi:hypothetical protein
MKLKEQILFLGTLEWTEGRSDCALTLRNFRLFDESKDVPPGG